MIPKTEKLIKINAFGDRAYALKGSDGAIYVVDTSDTYNPFLMAAVDSVVDERRMKCEYLTDRVIKCIEKASN